MNIFQLSKVKSPKDDLAKELRTVKKKSRTKIDETLRQEEEEQAALEVADDGTLPMPDEEAIEPSEAPAAESTVTFAEPEVAEGEEVGVEDKVKKLKKKKEKVEEEEGNFLMKPGSILIVFVWSLYKAGWNTWRIFFKSFIRPNKNVCIYSHMLKKIRLGRSEIFFFIILDNFFILFLAHLSQRLKWAIVIAHRPSVCKLSHFRLLLQNRLMEFDETW